MALNKFLMEVFLPATLSWEPGSSVDGFIKSTIHWGKGWNKVTQSEVRGDI